MRSQDGVDPFVGCRYSPRRLSNPDAVAYTVKAWCPLTAICSALMLSANPAVSVRSGIQHGVDHCRDIVWAVERHRGWIIAGIVKHGVTEVVRCGNDVPVAGDGFGEVGCRISGSGGAVRVDHQRKRASVEMSSVVATNACDDARKRSPGVAIARE